MKGFRFEQFAIAKGFLTPEQLEEAKRIQKRVADDGLEVAVEEVVVKKGWITPAQLAAVHAVMGEGDRELVRGYEVLCRLGQGGMGTVYKAKRLDSGRIVAIKILLPHFANERDAVERFRREATILRDLSHPNIVAGLDAGFQNGVYYYVMEYVDGTSLSQRVNQTGKLPWTDAIAVMKQMAEALIYAARMQMVHRDIKPDNILIGKDGVAKLTDLGLAKMTLTRPHTTLTQTGWMVGTPAYMSPEQMSQGKDADVRSDIYSLGMTFFTVLTGTAAYQGDTTISIMQQRMTHDIPYKKLSLAGVPEGLVTVIRHMTVKDRSYRYETPEDLLEDLKAVERGEAPVNAKKLPATRTATQRITAKLVQEAGAALSPADAPSRAPMRGRKAMIVVVGALGLVLAGLIAWQNLHPDPASKKIPQTSEEEAVYQKALDFEAGNPDRLEEVLAVFQNARARISSPPLSGKLDERIAEIRRKLKDSMGARADKLRETVARCLQDKRIDDAKKALSDAAPAFRCDEWKETVKSIQALIDSRSQ